MYEPARKEFLGVKTLASLQDHEKFRIRVNLIKKQENCLRDKKNPKLTHKLEKVDNV